VPIGAETIWEAAERQKKRVALLAWPAADGSGPRRRGDVGMGWVAGAERAPLLRDLGPADWRRGAGPPRAHVTLSGGAGAAAAGFGLAGAARGGGRGGRPRPPGRAGAG